MLQRNENANVYRVHDYNDRRRSVGITSPAERYARIASKLNCYDSKARLCCCKVSACTVDGGNGDYRDSAEPDAAAAMLDKTATANLLLCYGEITIVDVIDADAMYNVFVLPMQRGTPSLGRPF